MRILLFLVAMTVAAACGGVEPSSTSHISSGQGAGGADGEEPLCILVWPGGVEQEWCFPPAEEWPHRGVCWRSPGHCPGGGTHYTCYRRTDFFDRPVHEYSKDGGSCMTRTPECRLGAMDNPACCEELGFAQAGEVEVTCEDLAAPD